MILKSVQGSEGCLLELAEVELEVEVAQALEAGSAVREDRMERAKRYGRFVCQLSCQLTFVMG